jgi:hypothetical protein
MLSNLSIDTLGGDDVLTLDFSAGEVRPSLVATGFGWRMGGGHESLTLSGPVSYAFTTDPAATETPNLALSLIGSATATLDAPVFHLDALNLATGTAASLPAGGGQRTLVVAGALSITGTAKLDLADHAMIVRAGGGVAAVQPLVAAGFSHGAWNGPGGIVSTAAASNPAGITAIGLASNANLDRIAFAGVTGLTPSDVLVRYTYYGDSDLSGATTLDDFTLFLAGYQSGSTGWFQGDFDYGGLATLDDFPVFLSGYRNQGPPLP